MSGRLLVCATPIGNLGDVTLRVLDALRSADAVLAEDTRVTRKLFARYDIHTPLERFDEEVASRKTPDVIARIEAGETLALASDAGTPGVSDPGARLIEAAAGRGLVIEPLPGASALLAALVASGLPMQRFYFGGFVPRKAGERARAFADLALLDATLVFFESPRRTAATLAVLAEAFPDRSGAVARELTKLHEEVARAPLGELAAEFEARETLKGEVVIVVGPPDLEAAAARALDAVDPADVAQAVEDAVSGGLSRRDAIDYVAREASLPRKRVYQIAHERGPSAKT